MERLLPALAVLMCALCMHLHGTALAQQAPPPLPPPPLVNDRGQVVPAPPVPPDLSKLPEVPDAEEAPARQPSRNLAPPPPPASAPLPYLGPMLQEPEVDFVPSAPSTGLDPARLWNQMLTPIPLTPYELRARRLRSAGLGVLLGGTALLLVAVPILSGAQGDPTTLDAGYATLGTSLLFLTTGGTLLTIGDLQIRRARRIAAGLP